MAKVHILNVAVNNNPAPFFTSFQFEINFECLEDLQDDLEFKIIYVGSAETVEFDQVLDQIVVDAVPKGQYKFMFEADPPDISKIPGDDAVGVTVALITATFKGQEFVRIGYYVNNEYDDPELKDNPPTEPNFNKLVRTIAADQPRVTKFKINWEPTNQAPDQPGTSSSNQADSEMMMDSGEQQNHAATASSSNEKSNGASASNGNLADNKENKNFNSKLVAEDDSNLFQMPSQSQQSQSQSQVKYDMKLSSTNADKGIFMNNNSNLLFENSIDSVMN